MVGVIISLSRIRISRVFIGKRRKRAVLIKWRNRVGWIDDYDVGLFKVLDERVEVWEGDATAGIISAKFIASNHTRIVTSERSNESPMLRLN